MLNPLWLSIGPLSGSFRIYRQFMSLLDMLKKLSLYCVERQAPHASLDRFLNDELHYKRKSLDFHSEHYSGVSCACCGWTDEFANVI